ncbi:MAG: hypothetical protein DI601_00175 [Azospirillum brasilense]|nr:MAG: hypothetical protein DI601_00175 [Azospirillum brasilense]
MTDTATPTQAITQTKTFEVTDSTGRQIRCRDLGALEGYRLLKAMGAHSSNSGAVRYAQIATSVTHIDGAPLSGATSDRDIEDVLKRLGDEGFLAVYAETEARATAALEAAQAALAAAKN